MILRIRCVSLALLALLTAAPACLAAGSSADSSSAPNYAPRKGGVGGGFGGSKFLGQGDYSAGAQPRFAFSGAFRYVMTPRWRWQLSPGFTWSAYEVDSHAPFVDPNFPNDRPVKDRYLTLLLPISAQIQYVQRSGWWLYHAGAGPGLYRVWVENNRKVLADPLTFKLHRGVYPGASIELGVERFLKNITTTSVELSIEEHFVFSTRGDQFPSGFNDKIWAAGLRLGVNYYFDLVRAKKVPGADLPGLRP